MTDEIEGVENRSVEYSSSPTPAHETVANDGIVEPEPEASETSTELQEQQQPEQPQQTATDTSQEQVYKYMEPSGIAMYCIPQQLIGTYTITDLTGGNAEDMQAFEEEIKKHDKEPHFETIAKASYNFDYLMDALKAAKKMKATYITIEIDKNGIIRVSIAHVKGDGLKRPDEVPELKWRYYLAPYVEE